MTQWDSSVIFKNAGMIGSGLLCTLTLTGVVCLLGTLVAVPLALGMRSKTPWLRVPAVVFVEVGKGLPLLTLLVWVHYALPAASGISMPAFWNAVASFTISLAAFLADILRGGIDSIPRGHIEASLSLGLGRIAVLRRILIPETVRRTLPGITAMYITALKLSVLASVIGVPELQYVIKIINLSESRPYELYTALALIFLILVVPASIISRRLEQHPWFAIAPRSMN